MKTLLKEKKVSLCNVGIRLFFEKQFWKITVWNKDMRLSARKDKIKPFLLLAYNCGVIEWVRKRKNLCSKSTLSFKRGFIYGRLRHWKALKNTQNGNGQWPYHEMLAFPLCIYEKEGIN